MTFCKPIHHFLLNILFLCNRLLLTFLNGWRLILFGILILCTICYHWIWDLFRTDYHLIDQCIYIGSDIPNSTHNWISLCYYIYYSITDCEGSFNPSEHNSLPSIHRSTGWPFYLLSLTYHLLSIFSILHSINLVSNIIHHSHYYHSNYYYYYHF